MTALSAVACVSDVFLQEEDEVAAAATADEEAAEGDKAEDDNAGEQARLSVQPLFSFPPSLLRGETEREKGAAVRERTRESVRVHTPLFKRGLTCLSLLVTREC